MFPEWRTMSTSTDSLSGPPICFKTVSLTKAGGGELTFARILLRRYFRVLQHNPLNSGRSAARPAGNGNIRARPSSPVALLLSKPGRGALSSGRWTRRGYRSAPYIHNIVNAELWVRVMAVPPVRKEYNERRSLRFDRTQVQARKGSAPDENIFQHR